MFFAQPQPNLLAPVDVSPSAWASTTEVAIASGTEIFILISIGDRKRIFQASGSLSPAKPTAIAKVRITALAISGKIPDDRVLGKIGRKSR
ncbi:MAG: hypothetical protein AB1861_01700 [Cyanobacteriota bacterium]